MRYDNVSLLVLIFCYNICYGSAQWVETGQRSKGFGPSHFFQTMPNHSLLSGIHVLFCNTSIEMW